MTRYAALASAVVLLAVGGPVNDVIAKPVVESITAVYAKQYQTIVIKGRNFGTNQPYDGDSDYLWMVDVQGNGTGWWRAGCPQQYGPCGTWLDVRYWSPTEIVIAGFSNGMWPAKGDLVNFFIWNPQTGRGPAAAAKMVK